MYATDNISKKDGFYQASLPMQYTCCLYAIYIHAIPYNTHHIQQAPPAARGRDTSKM